MLSIFVLCAELKWVGMTEEFIFHGIDKELRRDKMKVIWSRYWLFIALSAFLFVVSAGGYVFWKWNLNARINESGMRFEMLLDLIEQGKTEEASQALEDFFENGEGGYKDFSFFIKAGLAMERGERAESLSVYEALSVNASDEALRSLARIESVRLSFDEADRKAIEQNLAPLLVDGSPWRASALELSGLAAYRSGDILEAERIFRQIFINPDAPEGVRQRSRIMLSVLASQEVKMIPGTAEGVKK
ncbi:MAG: tetratricopeptide repeat protein [Alphaproteobacteria bacterium]|nr:tetratricopeptide repeat protein [Alphaproteobacteria bacterium]